MDERNEISEKDRRLLEQIEQIALNGDAERQQEDSLHGFCAHLAGTVPQAGREAQQRLEARLAEQWKQRNARDVEKDVQRRTGRLQAWSRRRQERRPGDNPVGSTRRAPWQRSGLAWGGLAALLVILFSLAFTPPVRALAGQFFQRVILGENASVQRVETQRDDEPTATAENGWAIQTRLGDRSGVVQPGADPGVRSFPSVREAQQHTSLLIREPGYLPDGYALREVRLPPAGAAEEQAFLFYDGAGKEIVISIAHIGKQDGGIPGSALDITIAQIGETAPTGSVEIVVVGENPAAWIDGEILAWEVKNILYEIGGDDLSSEMAIRIAKSIPQSER